MGRQMIDDKKFITDVCSVCPAYTYCVKDNETISGCSAMMGWRTLNKNH